MSFKINSLAIYIKDKLHTISDYNNSSSKKFVNSDMIKVKPKSWFYLKLANIYTNTSKNKKVNDIIQKASINSKNWSITKKS